MPSHHVEVAAGQRLVTQLVKGWRCADSSTSSTESLEGECFGDAVWGPGLTPSEEEAKAPLVSLQVLRCDKKWTPRVRQGRA